MAIYDGVVTLAEDEIPVILELGESHVRLSASGTEIGEWASDECQIAHVDDTTYTITVEDEILEFVPNQPGLFASAVNSDAEGAALPLPPAQPLPTQSDGIEEAPPAKPLTMGLFYALCLLTAGLALWSLISIIL